MAGGIARPTSVLPVKAIWRCADAAGLMADGLAVAGDDADHARRQADLGARSRAAARVEVCSAGFKHDVLLQASAGAIFQASISSGKFHGTIWPTTPSASWLGNSCRRAAGPAGMVVKWRTASGIVDVARLADRLAVVQRSSTANRRACVRSARASA